MDTLAIFGLQLVMSLILCSLLAKWFLVPWLYEKTQSQALFWLTLPHATPPQRADGRGKARTDFTTRRRQAAEHGEIDAES